MTPDVSIVLITCNRAETALLCIASVLAQQVPNDLKYELIIVDDGSKDGTGSHLQLLMQTAEIPVRVLTTSGIGVPAARNLGARAARGQWIACFDDDQLASPGWLASLRAAQQSSGLRCVGGALALQFTSPGSAPVLEPRARKILGEHLLGQSGRYPGDVLPASNNVLIERELLLNLGGFDESFHQGGSDTEMFDRVREAGEEIWHASEALAFHLIPEHRLRIGYFRWVGLKVGATRARILFKRGRQAECLRLLGKRLAAVFLRDLPALAVASARRDEGGKLDARCSLWFTEGLARACVAFASPERVTAKRFLASINFRQHFGERTSDV